MNEYERMWTNMHEYEISIIIGPTRFNVDLNVAWTPTFNLIVTLDF